VRDELLSVIEGEKGVKKMGREGYHQRREKKKKVAKSFITKRSW